MNAHALSLCFSTVDSPEAAEKIAAEAVKRRLAAGVNIVPGAVSIYRWKGEIERKHEYLLVFYTRANLQEPLRSLIREMHPYEVPAVTFVEVAAGLPDFLEWIAGNTAADMEEY